MSTIGPGQPRLDPNIGGLQAASAAAAGPATGNLGGRAVTIETPKPSFLDRVGASFNNAVRAMKEGFQALKDKMPTIGTPSMPKVQAFLANLFGPSPQAIQSKAEELQEMPLSEQLKFPVLRQAITDGATKGYFPELPRFLMALNGLGTRAGEVEDRDMLQVVDRFLNSNSPDAINNNGMGSGVKSMANFCKLIDQWRAQPEGQRDPEVKQKILDTLHSRTREGAQTELNAGLKQDNIKAMTPEVYHEQATSLLR